MRTPDDRFKKTLAGKAPGILTGDDALARHDVEIGARFVAIGVAALLLAKAARSPAGRFAAAPVQTAP